jgi:hypothetical protein
MDQATATIIGALLTFSGAVAGALISTLWKREPKHQIVEYRFRHDSPDNRPLWIQGNSGAAKALRGFGWVVVFLTALFGTQALCVVPLAFIEPSIAPRALIAVAIPWGILSLIISRWVYKRIQIIPADDDEDEDDDD